MALLKAFHAKVGVKLACGRGCSCCQVYFNDTAISAYNGLNVPVADPTLEQKRESVLSSIEEGINE